MKDGLLSQVLRLRRDPARLRLWMERTDTLRAERYYPIRLLDRKTDVLQTIGRWAEVERFHRASVRWLKRSAQPRELALTQNQLGSLLLDTGNNREALVLFRSAAAILIKVNDRLGYAQSLSNIAGYYHNQGRYTKARDLLKKALALARQVRDPHKIAQYTGNLGIIHYQMGEYRPAIACYRRTLAIVEKLELPELVLAAIGNLALVYHSLGEYDRAMEYNQRYLRLARQQGNAQVISYAIGNIGAVYYDTGRYQEAQQAYAEHYRISLEIGDKPGRILTADNLGSAHAALGDNAQALRFFNDSLELSLELGNYEDASRALTHLGNLSKRDGDLTRALQYYRRSEQYLRKSDSPYYRCYNNYHMADLFFNMGNASVCRQYLAKARKTAALIDNRDIMIEAAVLEAKLLAGRDERRAVTALRRMLRHTKKQHLRSVIIFVLAMITHSQKDTIAARKLLADLFSKTKGLDYREKLERLNNIE